MPLIMKVIRIWKQNFLAFIAPSINICICSYEYNYTMMIMIVFMLRSAFKKNEKECHKLCVYLIEIFPFEGISIDIEFSAVLFPKFFPPPFSDFRPLYTNISYIVLNIGWLGSCWYQSYFDTLWYYYYSWSSNQINWRLYHHLQFTYCQCSTRRSWGLHVSN